VKKEKQEEEEEEKTRQYEKTDEIRQGDNE
jgi:hypothetical protein